eukprot:6574739-Alexandrium_andersonii.AAC.1
MKRATNARARTCAHTHARECRNCNKGKRAAVMRCTRDTNANTRCNKARSEHELASTFKITP